jgi:hypothetical protein
MPRTAVALTVALAVCLTADVSIAGAAEPAQTAPPVATASSAVLPPELVALEQKMGELQITSLRFSERTSITLPHSSRKVLKVLTLLASSGISGEVTISPPDGNFVLTLFGHPLRLRVVDGTTYWYLHALAAKDHGRPWIKLGRGGLAELFRVGKHVKQTIAAVPKIGKPSLAEPPFEGLRTMLADAQEVRELGAGTFEGQSVTSFLATLSPEQLKSDLGSAGEPRLPSSQPAPAQPTTVTLEVSFAQSGLPMRMVVTDRSGGIATSATLQIPAIDFPLAIEPPPASRTISVAKLRRMERRARRRKRHGHKGHGHKGHRAKRAQAGVVAVHVQPKPHVRKNVHIRFHSPGPLPEGGYYYAVIVLKPYRHYTRQSSPPCSTSSNMQRTDYGYPQPDQSVRLALTPAKSSTEHWCPGGHYIGAVYAVPQAPPCERKYPCRYSEPYEPPSPCFEISPGHTACGVVARPRGYRYPEGPPSPLAKGTQIVAHFTVTFHHRRMVVRGRKRQ